MRFEQFGDSGQQESIADNNIVEVTGVMVCGVSRAVLGIRVLEYSIVDVVKVCKVNDSRDSRLMFFQKLAE